ncbi:hypothetical protein TSAR_002946 [Trichomalopsis sarcophagae]|uniref:MARVEL domain-containing protein n=1 Tax=Trichomalopsis sarcophagae TaxID=543379 RepID=A0A232FN91_9HYME|nr:hypothetical protein TSAR_002946 [Trichomalopsis sarcophagae]
MSHSVTIQTRTVTTGSPSAINTTFCRSWTGILKLAQVVPINRYYNNVNMAQILGAISVGLSGYALSQYNSTTIENLFFLLIATTFMISSFILVLSYLCSYTTESIISKTVFELLFHAIAFALLLAASVTLIQRVSNGYYKQDKLQLGASAVGIVIMSLEVDAINDQFLGSGDIFLMLMATAFMIGTAIFIISYIFSPVSEAIIGKTNYEIIYNSFALFFIMIASIVVLAQESQREFGRRMVSAILGIVDAILYAGNTAMAVKNKI